MSSTEGLHQQAWPDLDVSYFRSSSQQPQQQQIYTQRRWEPPVFTGAPVSTAEPQLQPSGQSRRIESAFAHSPYPTSFVGWDKVRAESAADQKYAEALTGQRNSAGGLAPSSQRLQAAASEPLSEPSTAQQSMAGYPGAGHATFEASQARSQLGGQGASSAFTSLRPQAAQPISAGARNFSWPAQQAEAPPQPPGHAQAYGAAFDSVFTGRQPAAASARFGAPGSGGERRDAASGPRRAAVGQSQLPTLLVQCGKFSAPVQREGQRVQTPQQFPDYRASSSGREAGYPASWQASKPNLHLERAPSAADPLQLQEYYTAQSDLIGELIKGNAMRDTSILAAMQGGSHVHDMDHDFLDVLGPAHLGRAASVLDVPRVHPAASRAAEPYMPQWQSESVPAELPNHVVNRLLMGGATPIDRERQDRGLLGTKRDWSGLPSMPSIPDDRQLPSPGLHGDFGRPNGTRREGMAAPPSPDVDDLEELARTADVEVAHRAFLVPPHKKRGKGGRQPAADPRLDPNIDSRRAKRILANRLSAARSKMKQKNQMDGLAGMVKELEDHGQQLRDDAAELMEICEETEFENRRLAQQVKVLEEYGSRQLQHNSELINRRVDLSPGPGSRAGGGQSELHPGKGDHPDHATGHVDVANPLHLLASKPSSDSLFRGLHPPMSPGEALLEFAREA